MENNGYKLSIEHRMTKLEEALSNLKLEIQTIKTNHLAHINDKLDKNTRRIYILIVLVSINLLLHEQVEILSLFKALFI